MDTLTTFFSEQTVHQIGWVLVHFLWQGCAVAVLLWCILKMLGKASSNARYLTACLGLALMILAPAVTFTLLNSDSAPAAIPEIVPTQTPAVSIAPPPIEPQTIVVPYTPAAVPEQSLLDTLTARLEAALPYCVTGWIVGVAVLSVWYLGGWCQLQRLRRIGTKSVADAVAQKTSELAGLLGIKQAVRIAESALVQVPAVIGWLKPVILLPAAALTGLDEIQLKALLAHELAHIKRCDYLVNIAQTVVEILGFYHPAVWWMSRRIRIERENACDDIAIKLLQSPKEYARALFSMEAIRAKQLTLAVAATGAPLTNRISRLIGHNSNPHPKSGWIPSVVAILMIIGLLIPAALALKTDGKVIETKDVTALTNVNSDEMTVERLTDICEAIESSIFDVAVDYQWYVDPPTTGKNIAGTGLLTTVDKAEHFWATMRPFSQFSLTSMSADFTDGGNNNFHSTTKQSFNGKIGKYLQIVKRPDGAASNPDGTITKSRRFMEAQSLNPSTFSIFHFTKDGPLSKLLKMKELEVELNKSIVSINGFNTITVEISRSYNQQKMLIYRIYFAVDYNYTPIRFEHTNGREVVHTVNVDELQQVSKGLWYPAGGRIVPTDEKSLNIYKASKIIVNQGLTPEYFDLEFPPGTHVLDERTNTESIVKPTKEQKEKFDKEQKIIKENAAEIITSQKEGGRIFSANKLFNFGQAKSIYMMDHEKKFPENMQDLKAYLDNDTYSWLAENVVWLTIAETTDLSTTPIAFDKTLPGTQDGTNVLFADGHVKFIQKDELKDYGIDWHLQDNPINENSEPGTQNSEPSKQSSDLSPQPSEVESTNSEFTATLPNGVTVELVGVCDFDLENQHCWRPDGGTIDKPLFVTVSQGGDKQNNTKAHGFIVKTNAPCDFEWQKVPGQTGWFCCSTVVDADGIDRGRDYYGKQIWLDGRESTDIPLAIAPDWKKLGRYDGKYVVGSADPKFKLLETYQTGDGIRILFQNNYPRHESMIQAVLTMEAAERLHHDDSWGRNRDKFRITGKLGSVSESDGTRYSSAFFWKLKLSDLQYFEYFTRLPSELVTFKNVSLRPGGKTDVKIEVEKIKSDNIPAMPSDN